VRSWAGRRRLLIAAATALLGALAAVVVLLVLPSPRRPHLRPPARPRPGLPAPRGVAFGASVNLLFNSGRSSADQIAAQLSALRATGVTFARSDALWEATEPLAPVDGVHHYHWLFDDIVAGELARAGLRWLAIIDYSTPWAQSVPGQDHSPPRSDADYGAYAQAFAARYGVGGSFWRAHPELPAHPVTTIEVWNEPDNPAFWYPRPDAAAYARLYIVTREAVDAVDPSAHVIIGGLTAPTTFLPALVHAVPGLVGHVDGVAIHPYGTPAVVLRRVTAARRTLDTLGMRSVALYVTEFGWTTSPPGAVGYAPAGARPGYLRRTLTELGHTDCGVVAASLYTWASPEGDASDSADWYGISPTGSSAEDATADDGAAVAAFTQGIAAARAGGPTGSSCR
jgi:hypothetical protein